MATIVGNYYGALGWQANAAGQRGRQPSLTAQIVAVALDYDALLARGIPPAEARRQLQQAQAERGYDPAVLAAMPDEPPASRVASVAVADLRPGMVLAEDVKSAGGSLLAIRGQEVTELLSERLVASARRGAGPQICTVRQPSAAKPDVA